MKAAVRDRYGPPEVVRIEEVERPTPLGDEVLSLASSRKVSLLLWWKPFHRPDVETLKELIAAGAVRPFIDRTYPLDGVVDALCWVDDGRARGRVVITV